MTLYIINKYIEFRAGSNQIVLNGKPDVTAKLTWPAARCLEIMLERSGEVVSHAELYRKVWEEKGMNVPPNTLYQNISIIRRALKSVAPDGDKLIRTEPRRGFRVHHNAVVQVVNLSGLPNVETDAGITGNDALSQSGGEGLPDCEDVSTVAGISLLYRIGKFIALLFPSSEQQVRAFYMWKRYGKLE
ncbi:TPA: hypothetical protein JAN03_23675 [Citrobacter freundii]|nr:hypothetical protein [Citrobacter freundii]